MTLVSAVGWFSGGVVLGVVLVWLGGGGGVGLLLRDVDWSDGGVERGITVTALWV